LPFWFPQSKRNRIWALIFISLFVLSIDLWNWNSSYRIYDWFPLWTLYLIVIQLTLAYSLLLFSKEWKIDD
ncbi:MAG: hypothetical protein VX118_03045, partial [Candidatus Thermoplasmatota archaeon]|nr:hypothetical protein [Candidatus Thermoplasmatota archaeon]